MLAFVPILAFLLLALLAYRETGHVRRALLIAAIGWGVAVVALTEILSLFDALTFGPLLTTWSVVGLALIHFLTLAPNRKPLPSPDTSAEWPGILILPVFVLIALAIASLVVAFVAPPNNYDSMTYHMARVAHWLQNGSVKFYPTHNPRQLHLAPFAEFAIAQFQILSGGGDRFANTVQCLAYILCAVGVSRIAKQLGANATGQVIAAAVAATIPMALLQATNTQNDLVLALMLVALVSFILDLRANPADRSTVLLAGAATGLAVLTKGTAYPFALPILIWLAIALTRRVGAKAAALPLVAAALLALALNLGHYTRNYRLYGSVLGPGAEADASRFKYTNDIHTPGAIFSNLLRNVALHLAAPVSDAVAAKRTPTDRALGISQPIANAVVATHRLFNIDPDDPRTTWTGNIFSTWGEAWANENFAPSPIHFLLITASLITLAVARKRFTPATPAPAEPDSSTAQTPVNHLSALVALAACIAAAFLLFCIVLKWQQWHTRLHLPLFILGAPLAGVVLEKVWNRFVSAAAVALLLVLAFFPLIRNSSHPWFGETSMFELAREKQYFMTAAGYFPLYTNVANAARQQRCYQFGLVVGGDDPEYPLWVLLREQDESARLEHVDVKNPSARYTTNPTYARFKPCFTLTIDKETGKVSLTANK